MGSTHVVAAIAQQKNNAIEIIGVGSVPSEGVRRGEIVNMESSIHAIKKALELAEEAANCDIRLVIVGLNAVSTESFSQFGVTRIKRRQVSNEDILRVMDSARTINLGSHRRILHVLPKGFIIDNSHSIKDPLGMTGVRLECNVHIVTAEEPPIDNIANCCHKAGLDVQGLVLQQLAAATAVLTSEEKELGIALIDLGGGTTSGITYINGTVWNTFAIPYGGNNLTSDLAYGLHISFQEAERLKKNFGSAVAHHPDNGKTVEVLSPGNEASIKIKPHTVSEFIFHQLEDILTMVRDELAASGFLSRRNNGVVLTGGTAQLAHVAKLAEEILELPVRIGCPRFIPATTNQAPEKEEKKEILLSPEYSTAVGLALMGLDPATRAASPFKAGIWKKIAMVLNG